MTTKLTFESMIKNMQNYWSNFGFLVNLSETVSLKKNDGFLLDNGSIILIKSAEEELLEITSNNLMKITLILFAILLMPFSLVVLGVLHLFPSSRLTMMKCWLLKQDNGGKQTHNEDEPTTL